jgi:hypothetical protein
MITASSGEKPRYFSKLALLSTGGFVCFVVMVVLLHMLSPELDSNTRFISEYVHSTYGYLLTIGFLALGIGSILLTILLFNLAGTGIMWKAGLVLLLVWSFGVIADGVFPLDKGVEPVTASGQIHLMAAMVAFISLIIASLLLSLSFRKHAVFQNLARPTLVIVALIIFTFIVGMISPPSLQGLTQRLFVLSCVAWFLMVSVSLSLTFSKQANLK